METNNLGFWFHIRFETMNEYFKLKLMHLFLCFFCVPPFFLEKVFANAITSLQQKVSLYAKWFH